MENEKMVNEYYIKFKDYLEGMKSILGEEVFNKSSMIIIGAYKAGLANGSMLERCAKPSSVSTLQLMLMEIEQEYMMKQFK